jgi:hypothetical protein
MSRAIEVALVRESIGYSREHGQAPQRSRVTGSGRYVRRAEDRERGTEGDETRSARSRPMTSAISQ